MIADSERAEVRRILHIAWFGAGVAWGFTVAAGLLCIAWWRQLRQGRS